MCAGSLELNKVFQGITSMLVSAAQASTVMLVEALALRHKWYPKVYNCVNNMLEMLSKLMHVDFDEIEAMMEHVQRLVNDEATHDKPISGVVGESSHASEDMTKSSQPVIEEPRRHNNSKNQCQPNRRR
ncbi:hypothetical protein AMTR_s00060p00126750 [Amborella trichopoda]|uniref:Uncharacterized protein n=1 Tax=Amborella trichopoda TaxID=13333 RepID=W1NJB2_AMBTC|nr:hypothetical protein AMTR_s00060p00126750 [Amborella trichopoda]